jgi:hypothetical protein
MFRIEIRSVDAPTHELTFDGESPGRLVQVCDFARLYTQANEVTGVRVWDESIGGGRIIFGYGELA